MRNGFVSLEITVAILGAFGAAAGPSFGQVLTHQYLFQANANDVIGSANGTLENGATAAGGVLTVNSVNQDVLFGQKIVPMSGSFSMTLFELHSQPQTGSFLELITQGSIGGPGFYIGRDNGTSFRLCDNFGSVGVVFPADTTLFHNVALTVDSTANQTKLYIDGALATTLGGVLGTTTGGDPTRLGAQFGASEFFAGQLKDVRVYTGVLSAAQVASIATQSTGAPEPGSLSLLFKRKSVHRRSLSVLEATAVRSKIPGLCRASTANSSQVRLLSTLRG